MADQRQQARDLLNLTDEAFNATLTQQLNDSFYEAYDQAYNFTMDQTADLPEIPDYQNRTLDISFSDYNDTVKQEIQQEWANNFGQGEIVDSVNNSI